MTMTTSRNTAVQVDVPPPLRIAWLELTCLACGEVAGYVEDGRLVRPIYPGGIRLQRNRLRCGRCDSMLLPGNRGIATARGQIG
jgi:RNase P subunit RPR2